MILNEQDNGTEVVVSKGTIIEIVLQENPTTGYQWLLKNCDKLELVLDSYVCSDKRMPPAPGSGGVHTWHFKADNGTITLVNKRAWEQEIKQTFEIKVKV